jgi:hypothetical protein
VRSHTMDEIIALEAWPKDKESLIRRYDEIIRALNAAYTEEEHLTCTLHSDSFTIDMIYPPGWIQAMLRTEKQEIENKIGESELEHRLSIVK